MVPRLFQGQTIVCVGSGPSLSVADIRFAQGAGARILAVNSSYKLVPNEPDVLFAADAKWWGWNPDALNLACLKFALPPTDLPGVTTLEWTLGEGLDENPAQVRGGGHSGYAAINLAAHLGAAKIILLGYDLCPDASGADHCHAPHPDGSHPKYEHRIGVYASLLQPLATFGISCVNASRRTAIPSLPRLSLAEALAA